MLIEKLGKTRGLLLDGLEGLTEDQLNAKPRTGGLSIGQIVHHLYASERDTATLILNALSSRSERVEEKAPSVLAACLQKNCGEEKATADRFSKGELIRWLEESRFRDLQSVFNETHEDILAERSLEHPLFGPISLKNLVDTIWIHDEFHCKQIVAIKQSF